MELNGLKNLYKSMKNQSIDRCRFEYVNGKGKFDVFFFIDENPFILLFGAKGANFSFEIEVKNGFIIKPEFEEEIYYKLIEFLGVKSNKGNPFKPFNFFLDFNNKIPSTINASNKAKPHETIVYRKDVEEAKKIYFLQWRNNNTSGDNVSKDNLEKTKKLLSVKAYERCKSKNISSCWTDIEEKAKEFYMPA